MASNAALRQKRNEHVRLSRQRAREGKVVLQVVVDEADLVEVLRIAKFIADDERDPAEPELQQLLQRVIDLWLEPVSAYAAKSPDKP